MSQENREMSSASLKLGGRVCLFGGLALLVVWLTGLDAIVAALADSDETSEVEVVIKREALKLTDPRTYSASMHLDAVKTVDLTAPVDGYVRSVTARPGQKIKAQSEAVRLDDSRAALVLKRARANQQAAQIEKKLAQMKNDADLTALAEARLEAAQADLDLAQAESEMLVVRGPFNGEIQRVHAVEGQFVRAGEKLATLIDPSRLTVEIPVERSAAAPGSSIDLKVEETPVKARVESVIALAPRFDALRELTISPASALVTIENTAGKFFSGQTVYSDLIPLNPVALVPSASISNVPDGNRKVQVLRENVIRNLNVRILAKVGTESVFVSGRFNEGDEVIVSASRELVDGTPLRALAAGSSSSAGGSGRSPATNTAPGKTSTKNKGAAPGF
jgi:multidrug efflux pump subunit AcrA (membrane-fusion protein)